MKRIDGRAYDELRAIRITSGVQRFAEGSALIELGKTGTVCCQCGGEGAGVSQEKWRRLDYRRVRDATEGYCNPYPACSTGRIGGRSQEIQRFIGRSLRAVADLDELGERTIVLDCDVLQADGGTRTAAVTGAYVALHQALENLANMGVISSIPLKSAVAAISVGIVHSNMLLDLCYDEDFNAAVDFNVVMTSKGEFVEVQGTAEGKPFSREAIGDLLSLGDKGIKQLFQSQQAALKG